MHLSPHPINPTKYLFDMPAAKLNRVLIHLVAMSQTPYATTTLKQSKSFLFPRRTPSNQRRGRRVAPSSIQPRLSLSRKDWNWFSTIFYMLGHAGSVLHPSSAQPDRRISITKKHVLIKLIILNVHFALLNQSRSFVLPFCLMSAEKVTRSNPVLKMWPRSFIFSF